MCGKLWTSLQVVWSTVYVVCGAAQLIAGIFFLISIPAIHLSCNIWTGSWNVVIGIVGGILSCFGRFSPRRQEALLYMAVSILVVNSINVVLSEWGLYFTDMRKLLEDHPNHVLIDYACFVTRSAAAAVILVSFLDSQFAFCSMQIGPSKSNKRKLHGSHEQVSDIEYIIPRPKSSKPQSSSVYNAYSQSWVFDSDASTASCSNATESPYLKILENGGGGGGGTPKSTKSKLQINGGIVKETTHLIDNPVVHVEEASDDSNSNSDRKLCHMRSFSRSTSPVLLSASSSHISLNNQTAVVGNNPPIYECLETIYRSRLNTGSSNKDYEPSSSSQSPQTMVLKRVESASPGAEKVQYASLMKELQRAIVNKKGEGTSPPSSTSESATSSEKTHTDSKSSSRGQESCKSSDAEFSKELEAALQLIQDLESPNTIDTTPSDPKDGRPLAVWRNSSDASESEKTLSAVGSFTEMASPECQPELYSTFKPPSTNINGSAANGKSASILVRYPDSQSTSGYSSPSHPSNAPTPSWSTTSSLNGSNNDIITHPPLAYSIRNSNNAKATTVISLYPQNNSLNLDKNNEPTKGRKNVTLVKIGAPVINNNDIEEVIAKVRLPTIKSSTSNASSPIWTVKSLLRKKKQTSLPKLCPELEGAIVKSESLAYLSELELLARHQRNKEIQREIEERVIQQLGTPRTESSC